MKNCGLSEGVCKFYDGVCFFWLDFVLILTKQLEIEQIWVFFFFLHCRDKVFRKVTNNYSIYIMQVYPLPKVPNYSCTVIPSLIAQSSQGDHLNTR